MHIRSVSVSNFREIRRLETDVELGDLSFFIGDNGTGKTSLLESLNFCLSPNYVASRLHVNDFTNGGDERRGTPKRTGRKPKSDIAANALTRSVA